MSRKDVIFGSISILIDDINQEIQIYSKNNADFLIISFDNFKKYNVTANYQKQEGIQWPERM